MSEDEDEIILSELDDDELVQQMFDDLYDGLKEEIEEGVNILLERKWAPYNILTEALVGGMTIVGKDFRDGILFVPEVLLAANAMKGGMAILKPLLAETGAPRVGKMVIGTVKGDIHDIGKNLVSMMMEGAGFEVVDLGINNPVENYLEALEKEQPDILGMSALLTTTMPYMKVVIDTLVESGIRDEYIVLVGGAPLNEEFGKAIGADAYCRDAAVAVAARQCPGGSCTFGDGVFRAGRHPGGPVPETRPAQVLAWPAHLHRRGRGELHGAGVGFGHPSVAPRAGQRPHAVGMQVDGEQRTLPGGQPRGHQRMSAQRRARTPHLGAVQRGR